MLTHAAPYPLPIPKPIVTAAQSHPGRVDASTLPLALEHNISALLPRPDTYLTLPQTPDNRHGHLTLARNVENLLDGLRHFHDQFLATASLKAVYAETAGQVITTTDVNTLRRITVILLPHPWLPGPPPPPWPEIWTLDICIFHNQAPQHWNRWQEPDIGPTQASFDWDREIDWDEANDMMTIEEADALVKAAGYLGSFAMVQLSVWKHYPLSWCFGFPETGSVRVEILTGAIEPALGGC